MSKAPTESVVHGAADSVGCPNFEDDFWDNLYAITQKNQGFPEAKDVYDALARDFNNERLNQLSPYARSYLRTLITELYQTIALDAVAILNDGKQPDSDRTLEILTALELGDRSTSEKDQLQMKIRSYFARIQSVAAPVETSCVSPPKRPSPTVTPAPKQNSSLLFYWKTKSPPAVYGAFKSLATAYQSCEAGVLPALDSSAKSVRGISIIGTFSDRIGKIRRITNLHRLLETDYYLFDHHAPAPECFAVERSPLIYNYGGKPFTADERSPALDFFHHGGTGGVTLGVDCSGFIYTAFATAGLKVKRSGRLKALDVAGITSTMFNHPEKNGLTCLSSARFSGENSLMAGDLIADDGHVLMIASVGKDPFGIGKLGSVRQCVVRNISVRRYEFTVIQSSPSLGGIGINHMQASAYFNDGSTMAKGVAEQAVAACLAKFRKTEIVTPSTYANIIRHADSPDCFGDPVPLSHESCVESCQAPEREF